MCLLTELETSITPRGALLLESTQWVKFTAPNLLNRKQTNGTEDRARCLHLP